MIIYENTKGGFLEDLRNNMIADKVQESFIKQNINHSNKAEYRSWEYSLQFVGNVINDKEIDNDCKLAIEYKIPLTSKRVDFLIAGEDINGKNNVVIIELKQWEDCETTNDPEIVRAYVGGAMRNVCHPSYQAYSYAKIIGNFNQEVYENNIEIKPCAYLHNFYEENRNHIINDTYSEIIEESPVFIHNDAEKLRNFIKRYIRKKDNIDLLMKIENGKLKPAKALQDAVSSMINGNQEFYLIDEQKVAFETVKKIIKKSLSNINDVKKRINQKYTIIIQGGPGTGKSIVAIKLLADLINSGYSVNYVTKTSAPRNVYFSKLKKGTHKTGYIKSLFRSSGEFTKTENNIIDCLLIDEAHRLNAKSGFFHNLGEHQVKELIHASSVSVFFIDERQKVTTQDMCNVDIIKHYAKIENSILIEGEELNLISQFRCNGSDSYLNFLDDLLFEKVSTDKTYDLDYQVRLFNDPNAMRESLRIKNIINNKSRMLAGYCYNWITNKKENRDMYDINLENNFHAKWNLKETKTWAIDENSFDQVGCIHTSQGLEFDYVGVIIGQDLRYINNQVTTDYTKRAKTDTSLKGIKTTKNYELADKIIRNTYRTLLSRGQKGCYIYCEDKELLKYISKKINIEIE